MFGKPDMNSYFAHQVITAASKGCTKLEPGKLVRSRKICGPAFWNPLSGPERQEAGVIVHEATKKGLLPLVDRGKTGSNHRRYELM